MNSFLSIKPLRIAAFRAGGAFSMLGLYYIISKAYNVESAAHFMFALTSITFCTPIFMFGMNTYAIKSVSKADQNDRGRVAFSILKSFLKIGLLASCISIVIILILENFGFSNIPAFSPIYLVLLCPLYTIISAILQGDSRYDFAIFISNISTNLIAGIFILCIYCMSGQGSASPESAGYLIFGCCLVTTAFAVSAFVWLYRGNNQYNSVDVPAPPSEEQAEIRRFWVVYMLVALGTWLPQIVFYFTGHSKNYSYFSVSERLANLITFFSIISNFYLAPIASKSWFRGEMEDLRKKFYLITGAMMGLSLPVLLALVLVPGFILSQFGYDDPSAIAYVRIMAAAQFVNVATGSVNTILIMTGGERRLIKSLLIALAVQVACTIVLGHFFGGIGYAIAYAAYIVTQSITAWNALKGSLGIAVTDFSRIVVAALAAWDLRKSL